MAIFKPVELKWDDVEGGLGESVLEEIREFVDNYCYEEAWRSDEDPDLPNDLTFFAEQWEKILYLRTNIPTAQQTTAVLSLINGAFYNSMAKDEIKDALAKSATKPQLIEVMTKVACMYCQYVTLRERVEKWRHENE